MRPGDGVDSPETEGRPRYGSSRKWTLARRLRWRRRGNAVALRDPRTYLNAVDAALRGRIPAALGDIRHQGRGSLAKWWYGNPAIHYESTLRLRQRSIEIGLHFEADPLTNARLLAAFRAHAKAIARRLGDVRIEEWDRGWARVWEPIALTEPPGARSGTAVGERIAAYVCVLEPILRDELPGDVEWTLAPAPSAPRRGPRGRRPRGR